MTDKTEEPTPKRRQRALDEGDSGSSSVFAQAFGFVVAIALAPAVFAALASWTTTTLRITLSRLDTVVPSAGALVELTIVPILRFVVPFLFAVGGVSAALTAIQSGGAVSFSKLAPQLDRLDPIRGFGGLFSKVRLLSVVRAILAAVTVGAFVYRELRLHAPDIVSLAGRTALVVPTAQALVLGVAKGAIAVALVLGAIDLFATRRAWLQRNRMTKDEVKREHKESEGDPEVRAARHRAHQEMIAAASALSVKGASVVVVNPTHLACALRYDEADGDAAPVVLAQGEGIVAQEMVRAARDYGVPIVQNVPLAHALLELESGEQIPEALYEAVAEILREILEQAG